MKMLLVIAAFVAASCNPASRLRADEQLWCATHGQELAALREQLKDVGARLVNPTFEPPDGLSEEERLCRLAYQMRNADQPETSTAPADPP
jgi:hypothetical protein